PERFPVLGSGFHHHFLDLLLDEPLRQRSQLLRVASEPASLKVVFVVDSDMSHNYSQLLFVDVNPVILYAAGAESVPEITLSRVSGYRRSHRGGDNAPFIRSITHAPDQTT